jgi:phage virion morphogenesis protein
MIEIKIDDQKVVATLNQLAANVEDLSPIMRAVAGIMHHAVMENFDKSGRPRWPDLQPATIAYKKKHGYGDKMLIRRGTLRSSITQNSDRTSAVVGTNLVYAAIHQFGGNIGMPARSQQAYFKQAKDGTVGNLFVRKSQSNFAQWHTRGAHTIGIPARPFLKLTDADKAKIVQKLQDYLAGLVRA